MKNDFLEKEKTVGRLRRKEGMVENTSVGAHIVNVILGLLLAAIAFCCVVPMWHGG